MSGCAQARTRVCGVCTRKAAKLIHISDTILLFIKDYHFKDYNRSEYPSVICIKLEDGLIPIKDYESKKASRVTRAAVSGARSTR